MFMCVAWVVSVLLQVKWWCGVLEWCLEAPIPPEPPPKPYPLPYVRWYWYIAGGIESGMHA